MLKAPVTGAAHERRWFPTWDTPGNVRRRRPPRQSWDLPRTLGFNRVRRRFERLFDPWPKDVLEQHLAASGVERSGACAACRVKPSSATHSGLANDSGAPVLGSAPRRHSGPAGGVRPDAAEAASAEQLSPCPSTATPDFARDRADPGWPCLSRGCPGTALPASLSGERRGHVRHSHYGAVVRALSAQLSGFDAPRLPGDRPPPKGELTSGPTTPAPGATSPRSRPHARENSAVITRSDLYRPCSRKTLRLRSSPM